MRPTFMLGNAGRSGMIYSNMQFSLLVVATPVARLYFPLLLENLARRPEAAFLNKPRPKRCRNEVN